MKFRNAIDIMLFRSPDPDPEPQHKDLSVSAEKIPEKLEPPKPQNRAVEFFTNLFHFSAQDAYARTQAQIRINAEKVIREEVSEILKKALASIEYAIGEEKFFAEVGGAGRPSADQFVLKQAYSEYRSDSREWVCEHLRSLGYEVKEVENVYIHIDWSAPRTKPALEKKIEPSAPSRNSQRKISA